MKLEIKDLKKALLWVALLILFSWALNHLGVVGRAFGSLIGLLLPFLIGCVIAFVLNVLMRQVERLWAWAFRKSERMRRFAGKRLICLATSLLLIIGMVIVLFSMILPEIWRAARMLVETVPAFFNMLKELPIPYDILPDLDIDWDKIMETVGNLLGTGGKAVLNVTMSLTTTIANGVVKIALGFVFSFYVLLQKEKLARQAKRLMRAYLPAAVEEKILYVLRLSNECFTKYVTGQVTEACILGTLCFIGMSILRIPYAFMVSVLMGVTALIPMFGAFIGTTVGAFLILMVKPLKALVFLVFIALLQQFEGNLIYPRVVGKSIGLPSILVFTAVTIGGSGFGLPGMLMAVPVCSILYTLLKRDANMRIGRKEAREAKGGIPEGASSEAVSPEGASPEGTLPEGALPEGAKEESSGGC